MSEPTLYQEATDECVQGYGHSMMDSKCVGCGARNIFVVPVERCEHRMIDGHWIANYEWCPGAGIGEPDE